MAQKAQEAYERRYLQIAEQTASDHFIRVLRDPEYWGEISYQERKLRNNNLLFSETIKLIEKMKVGDIDIIDWLQRADVPITGGHVCHTTPRPQECEDAPWNGI